MMNLRDAHWIIQTRVIKWAIYNAQKTKFSTKDFFNKCDQISSFIDGILNENFIFCAGLVN